MKMELFFDKDEINNLSEKELLELHKQAKEMEKEAHKIRRLSWERLVEIRHDRVEKFTTPEEKEKKAAAYAKRKIRKALKNYQDYPSSGTAWVFESQLSESKRYYEKRTGKELSLDFLDQVEVSHKKCAVNNIDNRISKNR